VLFSISLVERFSSLLSPALPFSFIFSSNQQQKAFCRTPGKVKPFVYGSYWQLPVILEKNERQSFVTVDPSCPGSLAIRSTDLKLAPSCNSDCTHTSATSSLLQR
jgi:hypothetical protein